MIKKTIWVTIVVFIAWTIMDFIIHSVLLHSIYHETADLWRPEEEMNMPLMSLVTLVFTACFVSIYSYLIEPKSLASGIKYGSIFGLATGISMGFGSYGYMPIPLSLAISWFVGAIIETTLAGAIVGLMIRTSEEHKS